MENLINHARRMINESNMADDAKMEVLGLLNLEDILELKEYRKIGTPDECKIATEKQTAVKAIKIRDRNFEYQCPKCHFKLEIGYKYCISCGQLLKYSSAELN